MQRIVYSLVLIALLGAVLVRGFDKEAALAKFVEAAEPCKAEVGASDADFQEVIKKVPASTYEGKCLRACVMKKFTLMDANGKLDKAAALEKAKIYTENDPAKQDLAKEIADICASVSVPADHCEAAELYGKCFKTEAQKHGLM